MSLHLLVLLILKSVNAYLGAFSRTSISRLYPYVIASSRSPHCYICIYVDFYRLLLYTSLCGVSDAPLVALQAADQHLEKQASEYWLRASYPIVAVLLTGISVIEP